ncbi:uncharacterized protein [Ptychodera flava]|uniref:uncharacterized protein n=1 Tax=Ptychodera flava TaxID=63121 RepID=UPI00396A2CF1
MSRLHSVATSSPTPRKNKKIKCTEGEETTGTSTSRRRSLFTEHLVPPITTKRACRKWTTDEDKALVQYIALYHSTDSKSVWPTTHDMVFWSKCAEAISAVTKCEIREVKVL